MIFGFLAVLITFFIGGPVVGSIFGIYGFSRNRKAIKEGKMLGIFGGILCIIPILYLLILLFILGKAFIPS